MQVNKSVIVAIDSSGPTLSVGVSCADKIYTARKTGIKQEQFFLPLLQRVLCKADARLQDIKQIFFVRGPGRFTGIRISLTFASMMQSLNNSQVSSATLFEILYQQVLRCAGYRRWHKQHPSGTVAVVLHAFREEYFLKFFGDVPTDPMWLTKEELEQKLHAYQAPLYIVGTDKAGAPLAAWLGPNFTYALRTVNKLQIRTLFHLAPQTIYQKDALEPLYLKPARFELGQ